MIPPRPSELRRFQAFVSKRLGLVCDGRNEALLAEVLAGRASASRRTIEQYLAALPASGRDELAALAESLTVGETYFFRHAAQLDVFARVMLPELEAREKAAPLRFLSAGCASGEEAYSLAMVAADRLTPRGRAFHVDGVDINPAALAKARVGRYAAWSMRETPDERTRRWLRRDGSAFVVDDELRAHVTFTEANLIEGEPPCARGGRYHVVFCRNVLIYLTEPAMQAVVSHLGRTLVPGGFLVLGHAESLRGFSTDFDLREEGQVFFYRRREEDAPDAGVSAPSQTTWLRTPWLRGETSDDRSLGVADPSWVDRVQTAHDRIVSLSEKATATHAGGDGERLHDAVERESLAPVLEHLRRERYREGLAVLSGLTEGTTARPEALLLRAVLHVQAGETALAQPLCERVLLDPAQHAADQAAAHYLLALDRESSGDERAARDHLCMSAHLDPTFAMAHLHLGLLARRAGDERAATRELGEAADLFPHEDELRLLLFGGGFGREALLAVCRGALVDERPGKRHA